MNMIHHYDHNNMDSTRAGKINTEFNIAMLLRCAYATLTDMKFPHGTAEFPRTYNHMQIIMYVEILLRSRSVYLDLVRLG